MKLLFDQNISHRLVNRVQDIFPDAQQVRGVSLENYSDKHIWEFAQRNDYTKVTFHGDFYNFSIIWGHPPKIVWIRTDNQTTNHVEVLLRQHYNSLEEIHRDNELSCLEIIDKRRLY